MLADKQYSRRVFVAGTIYCLWVGTTLLILAIMGPFTPYVEAVGKCFQQATNSNATGKVDDLTIVVDSPGVWWMVAAATVLNQFASSVATDIVDPWCTNELNDDTVDRMRYGYLSTLIMVTIYRVASWLDYLMFLFISLQRPDFMMLGLLSDMTCRCWTTRVHLRHKLLLQKQKQHALLQL